MISNTILNLPRSVDVLAEQAYRYEALPMIVDVRFGNILEDMGPDLELLSGK